MQKSRQYIVYILTNRSRTLYIGVTGNIHRRMEAHRSRSVPGFASRYNLRELVYYEETTDVESAIRREKELKGWRRDRKMGLIDSLNPEWRDLTRELLTG